MSRLGIERTTGLVYEGRTDPTFAAWPTPVVSQATLIQHPADFRNYLSIWTAIHIHGCFARAHLTP